MISVLLRPAPDVARDPAERALAWRADDVWTRVAQFLLIGILTWLASGDRVILAWLTVAVGVAAVESWISRWALGQPRGSRARRIALFSHFLTACGFCAVVLPLLSTPSPVLLGGAILILCAVTLNNAMMARGAAGAMTALVGPGSLMLMASPLLTRLFGTPMPAADVVLLTFACAFYVVFMLRLAATFHAEGETLKGALEQAGRHGAEVEAALQAADAANRAKSDFLAVMSHELRTPLNGVLGMAQAMELDRLGQAQRDRLEVIRRSGADLLAIVDDLLDLSRIEAGGLELHEADFELTDLLDAVRAGHAAEAAARGLTFEVRLAEGVAGRRRGDAKRVRQVLDALVANAVKFTHAGQVGLRVVHGPRGLRCEVSDTGIGIAPDRIGRLFEPFAVADASMTRRYGGAGLGLALCRELVRAMGGEIAVSSRLGRGSRFVVDLPLAAARAAPGAPVRPAGEADERLLRVLAAEDNPVNQQVLTTLLAQFGVAPTLVENGAEAVAAWEMGDWDLILMDIQMPVMDGQAATRAIRDREARTGRAPTPIIAVTANAMRHQVAAYRADGVTEVIAKPIDIQQLFAAMVAAVATVDEPQTSGLQAAPQTSASLRASSARR